MGTVVELRAYKIGDELLPLAVYAVINVEEGRGVRFVKAKHEARDPYEAAYYWERQAFTASLSELDDQALTFAAVARATVTGLSPFMGYFRRRRDRLYLQLVAARAELTLGAGAGDAIKKVEREVTHWTDWVLDRILRRPSATDIARRLLQPPE